MTQATKTPARKIFKIEKVSKVDLCRTVFWEIYSEDYKLQHKPTQRAEFIHRVMAEHGMTQRGAETYHYNLMREANGLPMYGNRKKTEKFAEVK